MLSEEEFSQLNRVCRECYLRITVEPSAVPVPVVGRANKRVRSSSTVFAINSPKSVEWVVVVAMSAQGRTRFAFSDDNATSVEDVFELSEVKITIRCTRDCAS